MQEILSSWDTNIKWNNKHWVTTFVSVMLPIYNKYSKISGQRGERKSTLARGIFLTKVLRWNIHNILEIVRKTVELELSGPGCWRDDYADFINYHNSFGFILNEIRHSWKIWNMVSFGGEGWKVRPVRRHCK
jgi:hypothetical protein